MGKLKRGMAVSMATSHFCSSVTVKLKLALEHIWGEKVYAYKRKKDGREKGEGHSESVGGFRVNEWKCVYIFVLVV